MKDYRDQRRNQNKALLFLLLVIACFAICIFLTGGLTDLKKLQGEAGTAEAAERPRTEAGETLPAEITEGTEIPEETETAEEAEIPEEAEIVEEAEIPEEAETAGDTDVFPQEQSEEPEGRPEETEAAWNLDELPNDLLPYGYVRENRDASNVPTDVFWYESQWGQFNVDWIQDTGQNVIYLTMDDGFANESTAQILDILQEKDVKALFFVTKNFVDGMPEIVQRMIDEGHQLGNHTCTHPRMPDLSIEEQTAEIMNLQNLVQEQYGYEMKYFRFPEGAFSERSLGLVNNLGLKAVFWSYAYNDYSEEQPPVEESLWKAVGELHPGAVYLLHASSTTNAAFLADWIDECRSRGFSFGIYPDTPN